MRSAARTLTRLLSAVMFAAGVGVLLVVAAWVKYARPAG